MHKTPSNKVYIGITKNSTRKRWDSGRGYRGNTYFVNAIKKYGWENIEHRILFDDLTEKDAKMIEVDLIHYYKKIGNSLNMTDGGDGGAGIVMSEETKHKLSIANTGRVRSEYTRTKISNARKGMTFTQEHKKNISDALKGFGGKKIQKLDLDGNVLAEYDSIKYAAESNNINYSTLKNRLKNSTKKEVVWVYA